jgi:hypothetical protein
VSVLPMVVEYVRYRRASVLSPTQRR